MLLHSAKFIPAHRITSCFLGSCSFHSHKTINNHDAFGTNILLLNKIVFKFNQIIPKKMCTAGWGWRPLFYVLFCYGFKIRCWEDKQFFESNEILRIFHLLWTVDVSRVLKLVECGHLIDAHLMRVPVPFRIVAFIWHLIESENLCSTNSCHTPTDSEWKYII